MLGDCYTPDSVFQLLRSKIDRASGESEIWRLGFLANILKRLMNCREAADRSALIREALRWHDGEIRLPKLGFGLDELSKETCFRFGFSINDSGQDCLTVTRDLDAPGPEGGWDELQTALYPDPKSRRSHCNILPDGILLRLSQHQSYTNLSQKAAVRAMATMPPGGTLLATLPTGSGKSLLFQMAVLWAKEHSNEGETPCLIVVVPTVSLLLDHLKSLSNIPGLESCKALHSGVTNREDVWLEFEQGLVPILLLSPELALHNTEKLRTCAQSPNLRPSARRNGRLAYVFIDEAHIIETWGRSFRPEFQRLHHLVKDLTSDNPELRTVLLSATVNPHALKLIEHSYGSNFLHVAAKTPRSEFDLVFKNFSSPKERREKLLDLVDRLPRPALIYTYLVDDAKDLYQKLKQRGYRRLGLYTGETPRDGQNEIVTDWGNNQLDLVVATSAFGIGVDKADVRMVVHACFPEDASRYYQEIGRAGRDGHQALALCLWTEKDYADIRSLVGKQLMKPETMMKRWQAILKEAKQHGRLKTAASGGVRLVVDLDSLQEDLYWKESKRNREWNRSLLVQLQRSDLLEVLASDADDRLLWTVELKDLDLLNEASDDLLKKFDGKRKEEIRNAKEATQAFRMVFQASSDQNTDDYPTCQLEQIFDLVEANPPLIDSCGRCSVCRLSTVSPVPVTYHGMEVIWQLAPTMKSRLRGSVLILPDSDWRSNPDELLCRLARIGVQQFIVPDKMGVRVAEALKQYRGNVGLVLEYGYFKRWRRPETEPACLTTAVLLDPDQKEMELIFRTIKEIFSDRPGITLLFVADSGQEIGGRNIQNLFSSASFEERKLDLFYKGGVH